MRRSLSQARPALRHPARLLAVLGLLALAGCENPCQQLCGELADYANECGLTVSPDELAACQDANATDVLAEGAAQTCADHNNPADVREWWTCQDLSETFTNGGVLP